MDNGWKWMKKDEKGMKMDETDDIKDEKGWKRMKMDETEDIKDENG